MKEKQEKYKNEEIIFNPENKEEKFNKNCSSLSPENNNIIDKTLESEKNCQTELQLKKQKLLNAIEKSNIRKSDFSPTEEEKSK